MGRVEWVAVVAAAAWIVFGLLHVRYVAGVFGVIAIAAVVVLLLRRAGVFTRTR